MNNVSKNTALTANIFNETLKKLNGEQITRIVICIIGTGLIIYACNKKDNIEISFGDKKISINNSQKLAS